MDSFLKQFRFSSADRDEIINELSGLTQEQLKELEIWIEHVGQRDLSLVLEGARECSNTMYQFMKRCSAHLDAWVKEGVLELNPEYKKGLDRVSRKKTELLLNLYRSHVTPYTMDSLLNKFRFTPADRDEIINELSGLTQEQLKELEIWIENVGLRDLSIILDDARECSISMYQFMKEASADVDAWVKDGVLTLNQDYKSGLAL